MMSSNKYIFYNVTQIELCDNVSRSGAHRLTLKRVYEGKLFSAFRWEVEKKGQDKLHYRISATPFPSAGGELQLLGPLLMFIEIFTCAL